MVALPTHRTALRDECRLVNDHVYADYEAQTGIAPPPPWPVGPSILSATGVPGLVVLHDFLSDEEEALLLELASAEKPERRPEWLSGSDYEHVCATQPRIPSLEFYVLLRSICRRLERDGHLSHMPGTLTINWYEPWEGLRPHTDNPDVIAEDVVSISLGSSCVMDFALVADPCTSHAVLLRPGTVMIQRGEARYLWTHGIAPGRSQRLPAASSADEGSPRMLERGYRTSVQLSDFDPQFFSSQSVQGRRLGGAPEQRATGVA